MLNAGQVVDDFRLDELIHRGRGTLVFAATDLTLRRRVAFKVLAGASASDLEARDRFAREAQTAAALDANPHIVTVYRWGTVGDSLYFVTEFIVGISLEELIERQPGGEGLNISEAITLLRQVANAVDFAHRRGVVHRDIKPANVMVRMTEAARSAHLVDFGITKVADAAEISAMVGTPDYVAPEVITGDAVDWRADIYSLACTAYEVLSGAPPYAAAGDDAARLAAHLGEPIPNIVAARPSLPPGFTAIFERALAKQPEDRYESCHDFVAALAAEVPENAHEYTRADTDGDQRAAPSLAELVVPKRRRWPAVVAGLSLAVAAATLVWVFTDGLRNPSVEVTPGRNAVVPTTTTTTTTTSTTTTTTTTLPPETTLPPPPTGVFGDVIGAPVTGPGLGSPASNFALALQSRVFDAADVAAPGSPAAYYAEWARLIGPPDPTEPVVATENGYVITVGGQVELRDFEFDVDGLPLTFTECVGEACHPLADPAGGLVLQATCNASTAGCATHVSASQRLALVQVLGVNLRAPAYSVMFRLESPPPPPPEGTAPPESTPPVPQVSSIFNAQGTAQYLANGEFVVVEFARAPQPGAVETLTVTYADGSSDQVDVRF